MLAIRPRERMMQGGAGALSDEELIEVLVAPGAGGVSSRDVAARLLAAYGSLDGLYRGPPRELARHRGVGAAKACRVAAALELGKRLRFEAVARASCASAQAVYERYAHLAAEPAENVVVLGLDNRHGLLFEALVGRGSATACVLSPREVFGEAIRQGAVSVIVVHSHPSGDPTPSREDIAFTQRLERAGATLGIAVLDHVVIGAGRYASLAEMGVLGG